MAPPHTGVAPAAGYRAVTGPAGSGKSTILRSEAAAVMAGPRRRMLVLTSSERIALAMTSLPGYDPALHLITTPRGLCCSLVAPGLLSTDEEMTGHALNSLDNLSPDRQPAFDTVLVDEAQNLSPAMIRMICRLAPGDSASVTYFLDPAQAIFAFAGATADTLALIRAQTGARVSRLRMRHRPMPVIRPAVECDTPGAALQAAIDLARQLRRPGETAAILTRTNREIELLGSMLDETGEPYTALSSRLVAADTPRPVTTGPEWRHYTLRHADITPTRPDGITLSTVHTFRDRTAHHIVALCQSPLPANPRDPGGEQRRMTTARSRALLTATVVTVATPSKATAPDTCDAPEPI